MKARCARTHSKGVGGSWGGSMGEESERDGRRGGQRGSHKVEGIGAEFCLVFKTNV